MAVSAHAEIVVVQLPPAAAERGLTLQVGDHLREADDAAALDAFEWLRRESVAAARGPVALEVLRTGNWIPIELPPGRWEAIVAPPAASETIDLDAELARAAEDPKRAAQLHLARAQVRASQRDFAGAAEDFTAAIALSPTREDLIAHAQSLAFEQHPDRKLPLAAAQRAVDLRRQSKDPALAASLQLLAFWRAQTRDNPGALEAANEAIAMSPDTLIGANAHVVLAFVALRDSQPDVAAAELDLAGAIIERIAPHGLDAANLLARRAVLSAVRREGDKATAAYEHALVELRRLLPGSMALGRLAFNAQLHALERRRYRDAEALARESMAALQAAAPDSLEVSQARAALAEALMRRTEYTEAESLLRTAWTASTAIDADSYEALSLALQVGDSLARQGRFDEALALFDALELRVDAADAAAAAKLGTLGADTDLYRASVLEKLDRCEPALRAAGNALERYVALQRAGNERWESLLLTSECQRRLGALLAALAAALEAVAGLNALGADGILLAQAQFALARALRDSGDEPGAIDAYRAAIAGLEAHRDKVGGSAEIRARWAAQFQDYYKELLWLLARKGDAAAVVELEARYRAQSLLALLGIEDEDLAGAWAGPAHAALTLPADTALLSFVVGHAGTVAIVRTHASPVAQVFALSATQERLGADVDRLLVLGSRASTDVRAQTAFTADALGLYAALIAPVQAAAQAHRRWLIVADGPLLQLPWAALVVNAEPQPRYLIEDRVLGVVPSAAVWAALAQREIAASSIVAFADPSPARSNDDSLRGAVPAALPGARREVEALGQRFPGRVTAYLGTAASEAELRAQAPAAGLIHLALHSVSDAREPMASHIVLSVGDAENHADDGQLRADEIARELKLNADLTVLSSCASARGTPVGGEGLLGLTRALHLAGSRAVIGTTWPVADRSTARLMAAFYEHRDAGLDSADALAAAQRDWLASAREPSWGERFAAWMGDDEAMPESAAHPFYWAGFVHSGADAASQ